MHAPSSPSCRTKRGTPSCRVVLHACPASAMLKREANPTHLRRLLSRSFTLRRTTACEGSIRHTTTHITLQQIQKGAWLLAAVATQTLSPAPRRGGVFGAQAATLHAQREDCIMPFNRTRAHRQHLRHPTIPRQNTLKLPSHQPKHSKALQTHSQ